MAELVLCVDFGSTFTKALLVDVDGGGLLGTATHRTTIDTDLMDGYDGCVAALRADHPDVDAAEQRACSSAGGGLRIVVVGQEELVTAEAGRRVALSSGGIVVGVLSHPHPPGSWQELAAEARPDVVLLTGGTDGGNAAPLLENAAELAAGSWRGPVVVAGNAAAREQVSATLTDAGLPVVLTGNVLPRIGELDPEPARSAVREMFLAHVIGGKQLSARPEFVSMVRGATPDVVLTGVEVLAEALDLGTGVAVVDVGGATTDVHSVVRLDPETAELRRDVVAVTPVTRTVEGDLGMRWSAVSTVSAAIDAGLADPMLVPAGERRTADPGFLPTTEAQRVDEETIARAAVVLAVRRHVGRSRVVMSPDGRVVERSGKDLREIDLMVGSGGVLRNASAATASAILAAATGESTDGWQQPARPRVVVDRVHLLVAVGLLAGDHPAAAAGLARLLA
ncbi:glutamate mutase L [Nocardioides terrisoli]|uniref:glutamate mutase L n=1 Tax=Nocardioides terrisoli TaxID=3388267 RepID=UPI00287B70E1|nr:glutamate mutase L [Nocardioides marmorisolisilvae]